MEAKTFFLLYEEMLFFLFQLKRKNGYERKKLFVTI